MARTRSSGNGRLEEAIAILIQNQASFLARASETDRVHAEEMRRIDARFTQVEAILGEHGRILAEHGRILVELSSLLHALPDAIRDKVGFKPPQ